MNRRNFCKLVNLAIREIPTKFRNKIKNVSFAVEDEPSLGVRKREGLARGESLLGYYEGVPLAERGANYGTSPVLPDKITIYQKPIEEEALGDPKLVAKIVRDTIYHEVGHYFGLDEVGILEKELKNKPTSS